VTGSDDDEDDDQSEVIAQEEESRPNPEDIQTRIMLDEWERADGTDPVPDDGRQEADGVAEGVSSFVLPAFASSWLDGMINRYSVTAAIKMLKEVRLALGKRAALGTLMSIWSGVSGVVEDVAAVVPTGPALGNDTIWSHIINASVPNDGASSPCAPALSLHCSFPQHWQYPKPPSSS